jgi:hypothetical protein
MKTKIFCSDCAYEKDGYYCNHPKNLEDDHYDKKHRRIKSAEFINQNNDCKWFKKYQPPF